MELEELKQKWNLLDQRLAQAEAYNKRVLQETIQGKTQTVLSRLRKESSFNLLVAFLVAVGLLPFLYFKGAYKHESSFYILEAAVIFGMAMSLCRNFILSRFDTNASVASQMRNLIAYKQCYFYEVVIGSPIVVVGILAFLYIETGFDINSIIFVGISIVCGVVGGYIGRIRHKRTIQEIEQNLAELKELGME